MVRKYVVDGAVDDLKDENDPITVVIRESEYYKVDI